MIRKQNVLSKPNGLNRSKLFNSMSCDNNVIMWHKVRTTKLLSGQKNIKIFRDKREYESEIITSFQINIRTI